MLRVARCECLSYAVSDASASRLAVQKCCVYTVAVSGYIVALFVASGTIIFGSWCPPPIVGIVGDNPFGEYTRRHKSCIRSHRSPCNFPICWHFGSCILSPHLFRLCQSCGLCPGADLFGTPPISRPLFRSCPPRVSTTAFIAWFPKPLRSLAQIVAATVVVRSSFVPLLDNKIVVRSSTGSGADCFSIPPP